MAVFDINGNNIGGSPFLDNALVERGVYKGVQYYFIRINKKKYDGGSQYPFVIAPGGMAAASQSALDYALGHNYPIVINAGVFDMTQGSMTLKPVGQLIVNGEVLNNTARWSWDVLLIDENGDLSSAPYTTDAETLSGIVSACVGVGGTLVENYIGRTEETWSHPQGWDSDSQRMIIGQFGNGDYAIICSEGRGYDNTNPGWNIPDAIAFCESINLKFAYNLDGGGSTELVVGKKQLNTIYEGTYGRVVPTYIVFNGTTTFGEPQE